MAIQHGIVEKMEPDNGKLFIGGISWDTDEERLKEYFSSYGEIVEAVIMRDRLTGRARGFGFVVFLDPAVAQRVVMEKHMIDGRTVEAKKAVPREDHHGLTRNISTIQGSPGPTGPTKKIFVGGLPSTVTENDFKLYFDQFGNITDVVVMYDHNTQRPRGFGFITFDSEEAVDRVLYKTFHELNGKMVEVKRAVPKESTPSPARIPLIGYNNNYLNRPNNLFASSYPQGYNMGPLGSYGVRMDSRFSPIVGRGNGYNMGMNLDPDMSPNAFGGSENNMGYGRVLGPYFGGTPNRYSTPIGYNQGGGRNGPQPIGSSARNVRGNGGQGLTSPGGSGSFMGSGSGFGVFGNNVTNWGSLPLSSQNGGNIGGFRGEESNYGLVGNTVGRNNVAANGGQQGYYGNFNRGGSMYGDATWQSSSNEINGSDSFGNRLGNAEDVVGRNSEGYVGNYNIANRQSSREIAA